jgi:hypothetical protein
MEIGLGEREDCMPTCFLLRLWREWTRLELQCYPIEWWASMEWDEREFLNCDEDETPEWIEDVT